MTAQRKLWLGLALLLTLTFGTLLWLGGEIHRHAPPLPERVVSEDGELLFDRARLERGRQVWQRMGGMQLGSIWGHGALVAPDWSADWLHRESLARLDLRAAARFGRPFDALDPGNQALLRTELAADVRRNTYDPSTGDLTVSSERAQAIARVSAHYQSLFGSDPSTQALRERYAMKNDTVADPRDREDLAAFFFWTAWAAHTERPGSTTSYTSNWPAEPLVGNAPTGAQFLWSVFSVIFMITGIGLLVGYHAAHRREDSAPTPPARDPLGDLVLTPSMRATQKYFWVVIALFLVQILLGALTAHYQVEGQEFYGIRLADVLPYSLTRSWHTQLAVLWIATAWLGTGLFLAPAISGIEPRFQRLGVNLLFVCLLVIVIGAFAGQWLAVMDRLALDHNFWFGHQGWEYVDIGRFWQLFLFVGLMIWLGLMGRALWPALKTRNETSTIVALLFLSTVAIGLFYGAGLMYGEHTHISMVEYWRWWVVHLWVEGFFEVFATAAIAFLFVKLGLVRGSTATTNTLFATIIFLAGGVLGTLHHLYFAGTTTAILAIGASFSALEVVPLALIGFEAFDTYRKAHATPWMAHYRWPIYFFVAVAFWNLIGAGVFGFLINTPLALYYMQGLNLTPLHGHTALFGVYGMLGIGLMLFVLRVLKPEARWDEALLAKTYWSFNLGLALMSLLTLLPIGIIQVAAALEHGYWYARSAELMGQPVIHFLVWLRVPGDVIFALGAVFLAYFVARLWMAPRPQVASDRTATVHGG